MLVVHETSGRLQVAPGVATVGEAEIFRFMERELEDGTGMIVDARTPSWYQEGTIPGLSVK